MYKLFARPGWGSAIVEAQLAWYGLPFEIEDLDDLFKSADARAKLAPANPLTQVPTLVLPEGRSYYLKITELIPPDRAVALYDAIETVHRFGEVIEIKTPESEGTLAA